MASSAAVCAAARYVESDLALILVTGFVTYRTRYQIQPEERILREKFGSSYDNYACCVPRAAVDLTCEISSQLRSKSLRQTTIA